MDARYEIVRYQPDLKREVIELQTHLWSPSLSLNASYFEWKYERNPYVKEPLIYLAMSNGKVVGMRGFFGVRWECGVPARCFTSLYADDMVIAPEHRGRGLMSKIMAPAFEDLTGKGYDYAFNLSAGLVTLNSSLLMGWRSAGWIQSMRRRSWRSILRRRVLRAAKWLPLSERLTYFVSERFLSHNSFEKTDKAQINRVAKLFPFISIENSPRCAAMAELVCRIGNDGRIRQVRDSEYFQWRFQNPLSRYRYIFWGDDRLEGYLVLQEYTSEYAKGSVLNIVDWEGSNVTIQMGLLRAAIAAFTKGRELVVWSANLSEQTVALLRESGFHFVTFPKNMTHSPTEILVRAIANYNSSGGWMLGGRRVLDLASWDLRMLYSMHG